MLLLPHDGGLFVSMTSDNFKWSSPFLNQNYNPNRDRVPRVSVFSSIYPHLNEPEYKFLSIFLFFGQIIYTFSVRILFRLEAP